MVHPSRLLANPRRRALHALTAHAPGILAAPRPNSGCLCLPVGRSPYHLPRVTFCAESATRTLGPPAAATHHVFRLTVATWHHPLLRQPTLGQAPVRPAWLLKPPHPRSPLAACPGCSTRAPFAAVVVSLVPPCTGHSIGHVWSTPS
jgi:hypothetical protein